MSLLKPAIWQYQLRDAALYWVVIPAAVLGVGKLVDLLLALAPASFGPVQSATGYILIAAGMVLIWRSYADLTQTGHGTPNPLRPPKKLVISGSYRLCRHPMWLGYDLAALGVIVLIGSLGSLLLSYPLMLYFSARFLKKEEKILSLKFKNDYYSYQQHTPFLLPWPRRGDK